MINILFLCTGNSCRSQMAEGWGKFLKGDQYQFHSAGITKHGLNPRAVKVMSEAGVDITSQSSQTTSELPAVKMDFVFTVCGHADENCPIFPGAKIIHVGFDDPPKLTEQMDNEEDALKIYRRVRDEIREFVFNIENYMES